MARQRSKEENLRRLKYYTAKHPADLSEVELKEFNELKAKYG